VARRLVILAKCNPTQTSYLVITRVDQAVSASNTRMVFRVRVIAAFSVVEALVSLVHYILAELVTLLDLLSEAALDQISIDLVQIYFREFSKLLHRSILKDSGAWLYYDEYILKEQGQKLLCAIYNASLGAVQSEQKDRRVFGLDEAA